jgi:hypothetical protein
MTTKESIKTWLELSGHGRSAAAHWLVESMLDDRRDPFNVAFWQASWIPLFIVTEAWTPERKEEVRREGERQGYKYVDHVVAGDYDLSLWHTTKFGFAAYVVGINNGQHSPFDPDAQQAKQSTSHYLPLRQIKATMRKWSAAYGSLVVGSVLPERNDLYLRLMRRLFPMAKIEPYFNDDLRYGFKISGF